ncbi:mannose-6-phosphate isomerase, class I, partial [candidate division KSB1 bacterium]|nr:mannose-6-phosphate isomerase, class I [candidate division KSB1 bacterium]
KFKGNYMSQEIIDKYLKNPKILKMKGVVHNYAWGGHEFIPNLLGTANKDKKPYAELWIGAHPKGSSTVELQNTPIPMDRLLTKAGEAILGKQVVKKFSGKLPYLLKILDANQMLSIQVHPSKLEAEQGFLEENLSNIPLSAPERNYKDDNHKPEVHIALTDFWMLYGFKSPREIKQLLENTREFHGLEVIFGTEDLPALYKTIMEMPQDQVDSILYPIYEQYKTDYYEGKLNKNSPHFWAIKAALQFPLAGGHFDRGIFSIFLMNLVHIKPGQGTFQPAGVPHAYLEGVTIELMANSDNVLRGGLTKKHIDVRELLATISFQTGKPEILKGTKISDTEKIFKVPVKDFQLSQISISPKVRHHSAAAHGPDTIIVLQGKITLRSLDETMDFCRGDIFMIPANVDYSITALNRAMLYKATTPV